MKNFRDIEQLSSYLDGQLNPSDSARIESRISSDPELASVYNDLRAARGILRKLPARKAPRNFTLTRQMVGLKPPVPKSYPFFRLSSAFATILLMLTFAANYAVPRMTVATAPAGSGGGCDPCGLGGGGGPESFNLEALPAATEAPAVAADSFAITEAPAATEAPALAEEPATTETPAPEPMPTMDLAFAPTEIPLVTEDAQRIIETPSASPKEPVSESAPQDQLPVESEAFISVAWQVGLLVFGLLSGLVAFVMNRSAKKKWS